MKLDNITLFKYGFEVGIFGFNSIYNRSPYDVLMGIGYKNTIQPVKNDIHHSHF